MNVPGAQCARCNSREGDEVVNAMLAKALEEKTEFTKEEWAALEVEGLGKSPFIKSGNTYFMNTNEYK